MTVCVWALGGDAMQANREFCEHCCITQQLAGAVLL